MSNGGTVKARATVWMTDKWEEPRDGFARCEVGNISVHVEKRNERDSSYNLSYHLDEDYREDCISASSMAEAKREALKKVAEMGIVDFLGFELLGELTDE